MATQYIGDDPYAALLERLQNVSGDVMQTIGSIDPGLAANLRVLGNNGIASGRPRYYALPMTGGGGIATTATFTLTGQPSKRVKPKRLVLAGSLVGGSVGSFAIATQPQFLSTTAGAACPIEAFDSKAVDQNWEFDMLDPSQTSVVVGVNNNAATNNLFGCIEGYTVAGG